MWPATHSCLVCVVVLQPIQHCSPFELETALICRNTLSLSAQKTPLKTYSDVSSGARGQNIAWVVIFIHTLITQAAKALSTNDKKIFTILI